MHAVRPESKFGQARKEVRMRIGGVEDEESNVLGEVKSEEDDRHDPRQPNEQRRVEQEKIRLLFRSWCRHCVRGEGKVEYCGRATAEERSVPEIHVDLKVHGRRQGRRLSPRLRGRRVLRCRKSDIEPAGNPYSTSAAYSAAVHTRTRMSCHSVLSQQQ